MQTPPDDLAVLDALVNDIPHKSDSWRRRDAPLDPLLYAAAVASGPHITKNHYHHDFFPPDADADAVADDDDAPQWHPPSYTSKQAPRSVRLAAAARRDEHALPVHAHPPPFDPANPALQVQCLARARIPTPHGPAALYLYRNSRDNKEHLALVLHPADAIRSASLDAVWGPDETPTDRLVRGALPLAPTPPPTPPTTGIDNDTAEATPPLVRIHSECFTGETLGSQRCDCGEQLSTALAALARSPAGGAVLYLRQEGRGIGLLAKLRAYNLQDAGRDTVAANRALGLPPDARRYAAAAAILRDLRLPRVRLLTNNPDKLRALSADGIDIAQRLPMVPRAWHPDLEKYMRTKIHRMGHMLPSPDLF